jgi:AcrR family transcriptional regulator
MKKMGTRSDEQLVEVDDLANLPTTIWRGDERAMPPFDVNGMPDFNDLLIDENDADKDPNLGPGSKYWSHVQPRLDWILVMRRRGSSVAEVAKSLGISAAALTHYMKHRKELAYVMRFGRVDAVAMVENAHYKSAMGYWVEYDREKVTKDGSVVTYKEKFYVQGNVAAQEFILEHELPELYGRKFGVTVDGELSIKALFAAVSQSAQDDRNREREAPAPVLPGALPELPGGED